jgi:hypothetical protein
LVFLDVDFRPSFWIYLRCTQPDPYDNTPQSFSGDLAVLLLGKGGSLSDKEKIANAIQPSLSEMSKCISSNRSVAGKMIFNAGPASVESSLLSCNLLPQADKAAKSFGPVEVLATDAVLRIGVQAGDQTYLLFLPWQLLERGKKGFRFR